MSSPYSRLAALKIVRALLAGGGDSRDQTNRAKLGRVQSPQWTAVLELADELRIAPALSRLARNAREAIPPHVAEVLLERHRENTIRNVRLRHQLVAAVQALNAVGTVPLLLKGALSLVDGTLDGIGDRWMVDLDLLVPQGEVLSATQALLGIGYEASPLEPRLAPHELPFLRARAPGPIELHVELGTPPIPSVLSVTEAWANSTELWVNEDSQPPMPRGRARGLSPTHQLLHNVLHSAVQDLNHAVGGLPLRQLLALSRLLAAHGSAIDWAEIRQRMDQHGLAGELRDHLWLAHHFAGMSLPDGRWGMGPRVHEARVLANFALVWPEQLHRNLRFVFGRPYLDSLYAHGNQPLRLAGARVHHAARVLRRDGHGALARAARRH